MNNNCDNVEDILRNGLEARHESRVSSNKWIDAAVFASHNLYDTDSYGDCKIKIDCAAMKKDNFMPKVTYEPGVSESKLRESIAWKLGLKNYYDESNNSDGITEDTVLFMSGIPAKYLSLMSEEDDDNARRHWGSFYNHFMIKSSNVTKQ
jgi:hypothetical protein